MFGVADSVMIEDFENQQKFMDNLRLRFENDLIYVSGPAFILNLLVRFPCRVYTTAFAPSSPTPTPFLPTLPHPP